MEFAFRDVEKRIICPFTFVAVNVDQFPAFFDGGFKIFFSICRHAILINRFANRFDAVIIAAFGVKHGIIVGATAKKNDQD